MCYQKKVVRKSLCPKAIDSREQRAKRACLHAHLATTARVNTPVACSGMLTYSRLRNKYGNEQETIRKEGKTQEEKDEAAYDCVSAEDDRHTDTNYSDDTYGLRMSLHIREIYKGR